MAERFRAQHRRAKISAQKARLVADLIRGRSVNEALEILEYCPKRAAKLLRKVVQSAIANAEDRTEGGVDVNRLVLARAVVDIGPPYPGKYRMTPGYRGRPYWIKPPTSHLTVELEELPEQERRSRRRGKGRREAEAAERGAPAEETPAAGKKGAAG